MLQQQSMNQLLEDPEVDRQKHLRAIDSSRFIYYIEYNSLSHTLLNCYSLSILALFYALFFMRRTTNRNCNCNRIKSNQIASRVEVTVAIIKPCWKHYPGKTGNTNSLEKKTKNIETRQLASLIRNGDIIGGACKPADA